LQKKGESFTFTEGLKVSGLSVQSFKVLLFRMARDGRIEQVEKGKYIIIPLGAEKGKYTLNEFIIGSLLVNPYLLRCLLECTRFLWLDRADTKC
jgi:predicted transcriptional regulator of viral defense system